MGIYINGMRMPENCIKCPMQYGGMCYVMPADVDESRVAPTVEEALKQGKPDWCPLIEIPEPHGDLIDRDALNESIIELRKIKPLYKLNKFWELEGTEIMNLIMGSPTVIEGSENHEHTD